MNLASLESESTNFKFQDLKFSLEVAKKPYRKRKGEKWCGEKRWNGTVALPCCLRKFSAQPSKTEAKWPQKIA